MAGNKLKFKLLGSNILVKPDEAETKAKSGIILTEGSTEKPKSGVVVAVGTQNYLDNGQPVGFNVKVGDRVHWLFGGNDVEMDGEKYLVFRESQLFAVEEK
jgi:chaperonin GroES